MEVWYGGRFDCSRAVSVYTGRHSRAFGIKEKTSCNSRTLQTVNAGWTIKKNEHEKGTDSAAKAILTGKRALFV